MLHTTLALLLDSLRLLRSSLRPRTHLAAENLLLRKQLACYVERQVRPKRPDNATRITLALLSRVVAWRERLTIVRPETLVRWHRELYRLCWRAKSRPRGWPPIPADLQRMVADMAAANRTWGEERIAAELRGTLGITVSPRTVRRYMQRPRRPDGGRSPQAWATFLHNRAGAVLACDFFVVVTATYQRLSVFVVLDIATRRVLHWNLTEHPTAEWTIQQFRNGCPLDAAYRFVVPDRDAIFAPAVDRLCWAWLSRTWRGWRSVLYIVKAETVARLAPTLRHAKALFGKSERLRGVLDAVSAYERGQWEALLDVAR